MAANPNHARANESAGIDFVTSVPYEDTGGSTPTVPFFQRGVGLSGKGNAQAMKAGATKTPTAGGRELFWVSVGVWVASAGMAAGMMAMAGCATDDSELASSVPVECIQSSDCGSGLACISNACREPDLPSQVAVEVVPAGGSPSVRTQFLGVALGARMLTFSLPRPTTYLVEVLDGLERPVSANLSLFGTETIPGRELIADRFIPEGGPTSLRLLPGTYSVRLRPTDSPGVEVLGFNVRAQPADVSKTFQLPNQFRRLYGTVRSARSNQIRLAGVRVRAFGLRSGLVSSTTVTRDSGEFEIALPATSETFFRLEADPPQSQQPTWSYRQIVRVDVGDDRARDIDMDLVNADDQGTVRLQVVGTDGDGDPQPIPNARVTLTATVAGIDAPPVFSVSGTTDPDGQLRLDGTGTEDIPLIRARYIVTVLSPSTSAFSGQVGLLDLSDAGRGFSLDQQIFLRTRSQVIGAIRSAGDQPVAEALVSFQPEQAQLAPVDVVTGQDGRFMVRLGPGSYTVLVTPLVRRLGGEPIPVGTFETSISPLERLPTGQEVVQGLAPFYLPGAIEIEGQAFDADGQPEVDARINFFRLDPKATVPLGEAVTDASGRFVVIIGER